MRFVLTKHARFALQRRRIRREWIEAVLSSPLLTKPDKIDPELEHRLGRIAEYGNRVLRVVVKSNVEPIKVITVFWGNYSAPLGECKDS